MVNGKPVAAMLVVFAMLLGPLAGALPPAAAGRAAPDLAFRAGSFAMVPDAPRVGDEITSNVTVENIGDAPVTSNFTVSFYLNDTSTDLKPGESNVTYGGIGAGESFNVTITWSSLDKAAGVSYKIIAVLDVEGRVAESDETNNRLEQDLTLLPRLYPDLSASADRVWFDPSPPTAGDNITVTVEVRNHGEEDSRFVDVFFYLNDTGTPLGSFVTLRDLNVSASKNASIVWDARALSPGRYDILIYVNPRWSQNFHAELDTADNNLTVPVELGRKTADLAITGLAFRPPAPEVGDTVTVTVGVWNAGIASSPGCLLELFPGYELEPVANATVPALPAGGSADVVVEWNTTGMPSGFNRMRAVIDAGYSYNDTNRTNNSRLWNLTLTGRVDLALVGLNISPRPARPGDNVSFAVSVRNLGSLRCGSSNLTLRVGGTEADRLQLMTLSAGGLMNATLKWTTAGLAPGDYSYVVSVAAGTGDNETLLDNNALSGTLALTAPEPRADLRVREIILPAQPPRTGDSLVVQAVIENAGGLDAGASTLMATLQNPAGMVLRFTETEVAVPAVPAGRTVEVNLTGDTSRFSAGNYTLEVTADYANEVSESNESNNRLSRALSILEPAARRPVLSVAWILFAGKRQEGERVDLIASVANSGDGTALGVVVRFVIDGKAASSIVLDQIAPGTSRNATLAWTFPPGNHDVKVLVASTGLPEVSGGRKVSIAAEPSDQGWLVPVLAMTVVLALLGVAVALRLRRPPAPGPKVKLIKEEE
jgi:subtilase family serine protease